MSPNNHVERFAPARNWRAGKLASALSLAVLGCSVYDSSLVAGMQALPTSGGAGGDSGSAAGAGLSSTGGETLQGGAPAASGSSGEPVAGDSSGGSGGAAGAVDGSAGAPASGGTSEAGGAGSGGGGGTSAAGRAGGGSAGVAGSAPTTVELARGRKVTASSQETGNEPAKGNDGNSASRWCAVDAAFPQWWRVDLAATHHVSQVVVQFEHPDRKYYYMIETSLNDSVYAQQVTVSGTGAVQTVDLPNNPSARYVRITVTNGAPYFDKSSGTTYPTWASFWEIALNGT